MTIDLKTLRQVVTKAFGELPHPDVPGLTNAEYPLYRRIAEMKRHPHPPSRSDIEAAYNELQSAGISPQQWEHAWAIARPLANRLMGRDPELHELVRLADAHPQDIHLYYSNLPSPSHPEIKAGDLARYLHMAAEPAGRHLQRRPLLQEAATFAAMNAAPEDIETHYQRRKDG